MAFRQAASLVAVLIWLGGGLSSVGAQQWPNHPITVVSPFIPGTTCDTVAHIVLDAVGRDIHKPILLENRSGGDETVGILSVVKSNPDGGTLLLSTSAMTAAAIVHKKLPYDPLNDLAPVAMFGGEPSMLLSSPGKGYNRVADLVAAAKGAPGTLKFASLGVESASYIAGERFVLAAGLDVKHVAFSGPDKALADLTAGRVDFYFIPILPALALITEGRVAPLAISTAERLRSLSGLQTLTEAGYSLPPFLTWCGLSAPAKTPSDLVGAMSSAVANTLATPQVKSQLLRTGIEPDPMTAEQYGKFFADELASMSKLAKDAHIEPLN